MLPRSFRPAVCALLAIAAGALACAQTVASTGSELRNADPRHVDATQYGERITLGPNWLFAPDDNPVYASPTFDDSGWKIISTDKQLSEYGIRDISYGWYRIHIHLRPGARDLSIGLERTFGSYEVFVNGTLVGGQGSMSGQRVFRQRSMVAFPIPDNAIGPDGNAVVALRFSVEAAGTGGRGTSMPLRTINPNVKSGIFLMSRESVAREVSYSAVHSTYDDLLLGSLELLAGLVALGLCLAMRSQREYLAATIFLLASAAKNCGWFWCDAVAYTLIAYLFTTFFTGTANVAIIEFVRLVLGRPPSRGLRLLEAAAFAAPFGVFLAVLGVGPIYLGFITYFLPALFVDVLLAVMLVRGWQQGNREARVLLPAVVVLSFGQTWTFLNNLVFYVGLIPKAHPMPVIPLGSYRFTVSDLSDFTFSITMLLFLVLRTVTIARERAHAAAEFEAAQNTQQLLLARSSQPTPGFHVETAYYPASEVGGDFFLVSSGSNGSLIAIVGDVSGKGVMAAMRVAMILGILRREDSWDPVQVLHNLNEALITHEEHGFTTACCVRIEQDGRYSLANAGHIYPHIDGNEIPTSPGLPLGIAHDQHYEPVTGVLAEGQKIVLVSDGVVEARSAAGELFGFDRLALLTLKSAREIADTAKAFGQQDDITALTLARTA
jgi:hypothetical protein